MENTQVTRGEIETATDTQVVDSHDCSRNAVPGGVFIYQAAANGAYPEPTWLFVSIWRADEGDVAMGEAERIGEITGVSTFSIAYCPYCGEELSRQD